MRSSAQLKPPSVALQLSEPTGGVSAQRADVADAVRLAVVERLLDERRVHVRARQVHVRQEAALLGLKRQLVREVGSGTTGAPGKVGEQRLLRGHAVEALQQVRHAVVGARREELEGDERAGVRRARLDQIDNLRIIRRHRKIRG